MYIFPSLQYLFWRESPKEDGRGEEIEIETIVKKYSMKARLGSNQLKCLFIFGSLFRQLRLVQKKDTTKHYCQRLAAAGE
jgi:hypothetical protein